MVIRVLTFDGCPNSSQAYDLVEATARKLHLQAEIQPVQVQNMDEAVHHHFLGSPTIQVDGQDIEAGRRTDKASFTCRIYRTSSGFTGVPPEQMLVDAIREAQRRTS